MGRIMDKAERDSGKAALDFTDPKKPIDLWPQTLRRYQSVDSSRAAIELLITAVPFSLIWISMLIAIRAGQPWLYVLLVVPESGLLVRLFMIQHDCGHGAFFRSKSRNDWIGRGISVLTLAPYDLWRRSHAIHHATSGNLDRRGIGDIDTITLAEYRARGWWGRMRYRVYRNPVVLFGLGPAYYFMLQNRLPIGFMRNGWRPWMSAMGTNLAIALLCGLAIYVVGFRIFALIQIPIWILASTIGVWLFYVQHQFENTRWARKDDWDMREAALHGSSHYDLPAVLRWFTANIGMHHVHHLSGRIPYYRLPEVLRDYPELKDVSRLTFLKSLQSVFLTLWDEDAQRLISFKALCKSK
jgi:omega-6 fatty acid desaturase (delta-12 desaturase)